MKVIFIEDVPDVALAGETKVVADGYGRNYLLPKKLAVLADSAASNIVRAQMKKVLVKRKQAEAAMSEMAGKLKGVGVTLKAKVGENEKLYGSITAADIAEALSQSVGEVIDKRKIELEEPIRQLGAYKVTVRFTHEIEATVKVTVESDEVVEEKEVKKEKKAKKSAKAAKVEAAEGEAEEEKIEAIVEEVGEKDAEPGE